MTETANLSLPITVDEIMFEGPPYYGVQVTAVRDGEELFCFTDDRRRAIAAARAYSRKFVGERMYECSVEEPKTYQFFDHCGCHAEHKCSPDAECPCEDGGNWGLPPCRDEYGWLAKVCEVGAPNAMVITRIEPCY